MLWAATLAAHVTSASVTPVDAATGSVLGYLFSYGPVGIFLVALAYLLYKGWRLVPPGHETQVRAAARDEGRADLLKELDRSDARAARAEGQRDESTRFATDQLVPLLVNFNATTAALIPLLQELVRNQEGGGHSAGRRIR